MIIGFTGTSHGMTANQLDALRTLFTRLPISYLRHGDCIGADEQAHDLYHAHAFYPIALIHAPIDSSKRAFCKGSYLTSPLPYLERNKYIAGCIAGFTTDLLIAAPATPQEIMRSGTWATIRYARKVGTPRVILLP